MTQGKPGVILFFDLWTDILDLGDEYAGKMLRAALIYAQTGEEPGFEGYMDTFIWNRIRPGIDRTDASYRAEQLVRQYGGFVSGMRRRYHRMGKTEAEIDSLVPTFDEWKEQQVTAVDSS